MTAIEDTEGYPRVYRPAGPWFYFLFLVGLACALGGLAGIWYLALVFTSNPQSRYLLLCVAGAFSLLGIYLLLSIFRSSVVLYSDRIEVRELTCTKVLLRAEIRGFRWILNAPRGLVIVPKSPAQQTLSFAVIWSVDDAFEEWMENLPDLDVEDLETELAEIESDIRLGGTEDERDDALATGTRIAKYLNGVTWIVLGWCFFDPVPYALAIAILALLPWAALVIVWRSNGLIRIDGTPNGLRPNVALPFILPGLILALRSLFDHDVIYSPILIWLSLGAAGLLFAGAAMADSSWRTNKVAAFAFLLLSVAYGFGAAIQANILLDFSGEQTYAVSVVTKQITRGKVTTYNLKLAAWGPDPKATDLRVSRDTYDAIQPGDTVEIRLKPGALGVPWYSMHHWTRGGGHK